MNEDLMVVTGLVMFALSAFPLLNGISRGEMSRFWAVFAIAGVALTTAVMVQNPNTYTAETLPQAIGRVFARFL